MNKTLTLVVYMAIVTWLTLLVASLIRAKGWTPAGTKMALGNRDNLPEATPLAGRAQRTAANYTDDAQILAPQHPAVQGKAAILAFSPRATESRASLRQISPPIPP